MHSWPKSFNFVVDIWDYFYKLNINETQEFSSIESLKLVILYKITCFTSIGYKGNKSIIPDISEKYPCF